MGDEAVPSFETVVAQLRDGDPEVRSRAAVRIAEMWRGSDDGVPPDEALLDLLAEHDRVYPGIADTFWTTIVYDFYGDRSAIRRWMLAVLEARKTIFKLTPVPGNDLEFYTHEEFDDDPEALHKLLEWGYIDTVASALDHGVLPRDDMISLLRALDAKWDQRLAGETLAVTYGVLLPRTLDAWPERTLPSGARVRIHALVYGSGVNVTWFFPWPNPAPLSDGDCLSLLTDAPEGPALDGRDYARVPFPEIPQSWERVLTPRRDTEVRVLVNADGRVVAGRVVRARG
jgi:hypothetical protein